MDLRGYLRVLRTRWRAIGACTILGLGAAALVTVLATPYYSASVQLFVATNGEKGDSAYQGGLFMQARVKSYTQIVNSPAVTRGVIAALGLQTTPEQLGREITAVAPLDTVLIDITVRDASAARAEAIANATALQFTRIVAQVEGTTASGQPLVKITVLRPASVPSSVTSPRPKLNLAIGFLVGLIVGVVLGVIRESLATSAAEADERDRRTAASPRDVPPFEEGPPRPPVVEDEDQRQTTGAVAQIARRSRWSSRPQRQ